MHYSQIQSAVNSTVQPGLGEAELLRVELQGFIDVAMLEARLGELNARFEQRAPSAVLCDLRSVAGYGAGTPTLAREWFMHVRRAGVRRVALVATSTVLRTAALLLARDLDLELRCFLGETEAQRWLVA